MSRAAIHPVPDAFARTHAREASSASLFSGLTRPKTGALYPALYTFPLYSAWLGGKQRIRATLTGRLT